LKLDAQPYRSQSEVYLDGILKICRVLFPFYTNSNVYAEDTAGGTCVRGLTRIHEIVVIACDGGKITD
jgi:hypothetical protein